MENIDNYEYEKKYWNMGFNNIAGVDEVGRGPLIGPVVTACVVLPHNFKLEGLTDSKKLHLGGVTTFASALPNFVSI